MHADTAAFSKLIRHPVKFRLFLLKNLPSAFFSGVRVVSIDGSTCAVSGPYAWFSRNPFRSTYFACLAMAAEMSTGALAMGYLYQIKPRVSMLVTGMEGQFIKKATGVTTFTCEHGQLIRDAITAAIGSGEAQTIKVKSTGWNTEGEMVAEFFINWSFKVRSGKG